VPAVPETLTLAQGTETPTGFWNVTCWVNVPADDGAKVNVRVSIPFGWDCGGSAYISERRANRGCARFQSQSPVFLTITGEGYREEPTGVRGAVPEPAIIAAPRIALSWSVPFPPPVNVKYRNRGHIGLNCIRCISDFECSYPPPDSDDEVAGFKTVTSLRRLRRP